MLNADVVRHASHGTASLRKKNSPPNIILILTDDQGWADVGFNGSKDIPTPNLDRLAGEGIIFSNAYVSHPYCSPSRAGLLTGRYQARFGHDCNISKEGYEDETIGIPLNEVLISEALQEEGYRTGAIGKWHVGDHPSLQPPRQGFDHWFGFAAGAMNYWGRPNGPVRTIFRNDEEVPAEELHYLTDDFSQEAVDFIQEDPSAPFFIYLAYNAPHAPDQVTETYLDRTKHIEYGGRSVYAAMINAVDAGVGRIDSALTALGIKENTLIAFLSDNGGRITHADNRPFRGHKGMLFEGGIKVPCFMTYPAVIPSGKVYQQPISALDLYPTFLSVANSNNIKADLAGVDLMPFVLNESAGRPHDYLYWRSVGGFEYAVRFKDHKLYKSAYKEKTLLFDLNADPYERNDIAAQHPDMVGKLQQAYRTWDAENLAPGWLDPHRENVLLEEQRWREVRSRSQKNRKH
ncbi:MAG: sulfatase-like hydrolase/transferase [Saprospiraceae bacterium]|nr:sulfatase-like hydrolase/transferase [Saprospiraceae bacterium]